MDSKILVAVVVILCSFDVTNANKMCYNCTQAVNSKCGDILDTAGIDTTACETGKCVITQSTTGDVVTYARSCEAEACEDDTECTGTDTVTCTKCCDTDLCNTDYTVPTEEPMTTEAGASNTVVNIATIMFTLFLFKSMV